MKKGYLFIFKKILVVVFCSNTPCDQVTTSQGLPVFSSSSKLVRNLFYDKTVLKETQWSVQKEQYRKSSGLWRTCTYQFCFEKFNVNYTELKTKLGKLIHVNVWIDLRLFKISCWFPRFKHICRPMRARVVFSFFFIKCYNLLLTLKNDDTF